jgi:hypothetical protein
MQLTGLSLQWALLCFEVGIESGLKRINEKDVPRYCIRVSKPYRDALAFWVVRLLTEGKIEAEHANSFIEMINNNIIKLAVTLSNSGFVYCKEIELKGDGLEFYKALKQISIEENNNKSAELTGEHTEDSNLMTEDEIHNFGLNVVLEYIQKDGFSVETVIRDKRINPQIIAKKNEQIAYILVRTDCYPRKGEPENREVVLDMLKNAEKINAVCYFASVGIANSYGTTDLEMSIPTKGAEYYVAFDGLVKINENYIPKQDYTIRAFNKNGNLAGGAVKGNDGRYTIIKGDKSDISSLLMTNFYVFADMLSIDQEFTKTFSKWADLPSTEWSQLHKETCALAMIHFIMDAKNKNLGLPANIVKAIEAFPAQNLAPLRRPLTPEIQKFFSNMFSGKSK